MIWSCFLFCILFIVELGCDAVLRAGKNTAIIKRLQNTEMWKTTILDILEANCTTPWTSILKWETVLLHRSNWKSTLRWTHLMPSYTHKAPFHFLFLTSVWSQVWYRRSNTGSILLHRLTVLISALNNLRQLQPRTNWKYLDNNERKLATVNAGMFVIIHPGKCLVITSAGMISSSVAGTIFWFLNTSSLTW